jgi:type IV pilus assembly protein PilW
MVREIPHLRRRRRGFGLVELMVAVAIGLVAILVITSVFLQAQRHNRTTTGAASAQENALIALVTVERDLRMAGIGLIGSGCARVNTYVAAMSPPAFDFSALPVTIARDAATNSDRIRVTYGGSAFGNSPTSLAFTMTRSSDPLSVENGNGFAAGDVLLLSQAPANCSLLRASGAAVLAGGVWTIPHAAPPENIFPSGGYATGARIASMGAMVRREYFVDNGSLMMRDLNAPDSTEPPVNPVPLVSGVVALRAQYGRDAHGDVRFDLTPPASADELVAIRIAVVARSSQRERETVSDAKLRLWYDATAADGGELELTEEEARRHRYRVYQTVIPLRNVIWNTP